jgi:hypothetical protein
VITDIEITYDGNRGETNNLPLAFVIDQDVLYTIATSNLGGNLFLDFTDAIDVSEDFPENDGLTIKFMNNETELETLHTSEYFGSILLSNPRVINLLNHKRGYATGEPANFIDNEFYVLDGRDNSTLSDWTYYNMKDDGYECGGDLCGCKK